MILYEEKRKILNEMARVGFTSDSYEIYVRTNDSGNIPHFHYWDTLTKGDVFHTCIRIDSPEYFHHTGKEDELNSKQKKSLIQFLLKQHSTLGISNWKYLIALWNDNNSDVYVDIDSEMPDYSTL